MKHWGLPFIAEISKSEHNYEVGTGFRPALLGEAHFDGDYKGILAAGLVAIVGNSEARDETDRNFDGAMIGGLASIVKGRLNGISYGTVSNYARRNGKLSIQVGFANVIKEYDSSGLVIQIGIYNQCDAQVNPVINVKGLRKLLKDLDF